MEDFAWLHAVVNFALFIMIALLPIAFYRVARPETVSNPDDEKGKFEQDGADRLVGVDMITNLLVGIVVLLAIVEGTDTTIDIGVAMAALSFAGTVSIARYISEGRVF